MPEWGVQTPVSTIRPTPAIPQIRSLDLPWALFYKTTTSVYDPDTGASTNPGTWAIDHQSGSGFGAGASDEYISVPSTGTYLVSLELDIATNGTTFSPTPTNGTAWGTLVVSIDPSQDSFYKTDTYNEPIIQGTFDSSSCFQFTGVIGVGGPSLEVIAEFDFNAASYTNVTGGTITLTPSLFVCQLSTAS